MVMTKLNGEEQQTTIELTVWAIVRILLKASELYMSNHVLTVNSMAFRFNGFQTNTMVKLNIEIKRLGDKVQLMKIEVFKTVPTLTA